MELNIQVLTASDTNKFVDLLSVFEVTFDMHDFTPPAEIHLQALLKKESFIAVVAFVDDVVVGGLTIHVLDQYYTEKPQAYLYDLAVLPAYQRKGIGKKLVHFAKEYCLQKGIAEMFVQAELEDDHAIAFYRSTGAHENPVVHFSYLLKP